MFNLWERTYVQVFDGNVQFDTKFVLIDPEYAQVVFVPENFHDGGEMLLHEATLSDLLNKHFSGLASEFFKWLYDNHKDDKVAVVVSHEDYYYLAAAYLKELQVAYTLSDAQYREIAYSYVYDNFYYTDDSKFKSGFLNNAYIELVSAISKSYQPIGLLKKIAPSQLPTEIGYYLATAGKINESELHNKFVNAAKMIIKRLASVHHNDFSEWLILDTKHFLNMMKSDNTPEILSVENFTFVDMQNYIVSDPYLNALFNEPFPFKSTTVGWNDDPAFKVTASRLIQAWEKLADYLVERGLDADWAQLRHSQYTEIILRHDYVTTNCEVVKYLLNLDNAPEELNRPIIEMLGYDILSECMDARYNKTLMLFALRGMSDTMRSFIHEQFKHKGSSEDA